MKSFMVRFGLFDVYVIVGKKLVLEDQVSEAVVTPSDFYFETSFFVQ